MVAYWTVYPVARVRSPYASPSFVVNSVTTSTPVEHGEKRRFDSWPLQIYMEDWQSGRMQEFAKLQVGIIPSHRFESYIFRQAVVGC